MFALYIDSVVGRVKSHGLRSYIKAICVSVFLYADCILLLAPSLSIGELELEWLDLTVNARKSACMHTGPRFNVRCSNISTKAGHKVTWCSEIGYLDVYITA